MNKDAFLESYGGQTTDQLIDLEQRYRTDSREETYVLAVEALEREVNNGGYSQFFLNSSNEYAGEIVAVLRAIGCPKTADITAQAVANKDDEGRLSECDDRYYSNDEPIADRLFDWIERNRAQIRIG